MATELFTNNTTTTVSSGGTTAPAGGTVESWTVASSASFPAASAGAGTQFHVADPALPTEKILVTNVSGTTWTVTRGSESTTPVAHSAGFTVVQVVTAGVLTGLTAASGVLTPNLGISFATLPLWAANQGSQAVANEIVVSLATALKSETINHLGTWIGSGGLTPGAGVNGLAMYTEAGALLAATGDMTTAFEAVGYAEGTLTAGVPVTAGTNYYLAFQGNFSTMPAMPGFVPPPSSGVPAIHGHYAHLYFTGTTTWPASLTIPGTGTNGQHWFWVAASV